MKDRHERKLRGDKKLNHITTWTGAAGKKLCGPAVPVNFYFIVDGSPSSSPFSFVHASSLFGTFGSALTGLVFDSTAIISDERKG